MIKQVKPVPRCKQHPRYTGNAPPRLPCLPCVKIMARRAYAKGFMDACKATSRRQYQYNAELQRVEEVSW